MAVSPAVCFRKPDQGGRIVDANRLQGQAWPEPGQSLIKSEFHNLWWILVEIAEPQPRRSNAYVGQAGPQLPVTPIRKSDEVTLPEAVKLDPCRLVRDALVLHRPLLASRQPADHNRDSRVLPQIGRFPR